MSSVNFRPASPFHFFLSFLSLLCLLSLLSMTSARIPGVTPVSKVALYYGDKTGQLASTLKTYKAVVLQAHTSLPQDVATIQNKGANYVFCYLSIGEDAGKISTSAGGTGPVKWNTATKSVISTNGGWPSYTIDWSWNSATGAYESDGKPDTNPTWGGAFVYPNAEWKNVLRYQRIGGSATYPNRKTLAGLEQIFGATPKGQGANSSANYNCDGVFLDTADLAGPFDRSAGYYPFLAKPISDLIKWIKTTWPSKLIWLNRAVFYFNPYLVSADYGVRPYDYSPGGQIDALLFESYTLDYSNSIPTPYFVDYYCNYAPKINIESAKYWGAGTGTGGFNVITLDYIGSKTNASYAANLARTNAWNLGWTPIVTQNAYVDSLPLSWSSVPTDRSPPDWLNSGGSFSQCLPKKIGLSSLSLASYGELVNLNFDLAADFNGVKYLVQLLSSAATTASVVSSTITPSTAVPLQQSTQWATNPSSASAWQVQLPIPSVTTAHYRVRIQDNAGWTDTNDVRIAFPRDYIYSNPTDQIDVGGGSADWSNLGSHTEKFAMAHDDSNLYFKFPSDIDSVYIQTASTNGVTLSKYGVAVHHRLDNKGNLYRYTDQATSGTPALLYRGESSLVAGVYEVSISLSNFHQRVIRVYFANSVFTKIAPPTASISWRYDTRPLINTKKIFNYIGKYRTNPIKIDGNHSDWSNVKTFFRANESPYLPVPGTKGQAPWVYGAVHSDDYLYIGASAPYTKVFISTAKRTSTSYNYNNMAIYADLMIEGSNLFAYAGTDGQSWSWKWISAVDEFKTSSASFTEIKVAISKLGGDSIRAPIQIVFYDASVSGSFPAKPAFFTYDLSVVTYSQRVREAFTDPLPQLSVAHDDDNFYITYTSPVIGPSQGNEVVMSVFPHFGTGTWVPNGARAITGIRASYYISDNSFAFVGYNWNVIGACRYVAPQVGANRIATRTAICPRSYFGTSETEIDFVLASDISNPSGKDYLMRYTTARLEMYPDNLYSNYITRYFDSDRQFTAFHDNSNLYLIVDGRLNENYILPSFVPNGASLYSSSILGKDNKFRYKMFPDLYQYDGSGLLDNWSFGTVRLSKISSNVVMKDGTYVYVIPRSYLGQGSAGVLQYAGWSANMATFPGAPGVVKYYVN